MHTQKIQFPNSEGLLLSATLDFPVNGKPISCAIFAHCFTCNKNLSAVRNVVKALTDKNIAVLRFDFTGLGQSEGDFSDSNFSSNISDLVAASDWMGSQLEAPEILIGHSLGGAAVLAAANLLPNIKAVATIGAPSQPQHVSHLVSSGKAEIEKSGAAEVNIGGRPFLIKEQFLKDLDKYRVEDYLPKLRKAILIAHSPQDQIVSVDNAAELYQLAHHPKSFVSLDGADHLLSDKADSIYVGNLIAAWVSRYLPRQDKPALKEAKHVKARIGDDAFTTEVNAGRHQLTADEPLDVGGNDYGPTPYHLLSAGLAACTVMTMKMYASRKQWDLQSVTIDVEHFKSHGEDAMSEVHEAVDTFSREIKIEGNLDEKQRARLMQIADKCPVHKTLHSPVSIPTKEIS